MSRCFPFPPPGFLKIYDEKVLIERERLKKKIEKKRRKKEERRQNRCGERAVVKEKHHGRKWGNHERGKGKHKGQDHKTKRRKESDQLEMNNFTEEHGRVVGTQNFTEEHANIDSSENVCCRGKRDRDSSSSPCETTSQKKHRTGRIACNTSTYGNGVWHQLPALSSIKQSQKLNKYNGVTEPAGRLQTTAVACRDSSSVHRTKAQFIDGISFHFPPLPTGPIEFTPTNPEQLDWLFEKVQCAQESRRCETNEEEGEDIPQVWSQACHVQPAGLYALP